MLDLFGISSQFSLGSIFGAGTCLGDAAVLFPVQHQGHTM